jgi:adenylate cyclase
VIWGEFMENKRKSYLISVLFSLIVTLFMILTMSTNMLKGLDYAIYDNFYEKENSFSQNIVIVGIDAETLSTIGEYSSWDKRKLYAEAINNINEYNPSVIGVDVLFTGTSYETSDQMLVDAVKNKNNVVLATEIGFVDEVVDGVHQKVMKIDRPYDALYEAAGESNLGFVNTSSDKDGILRRATLNATYDGVSYSSFGEQIYKKYADSNDLDYSGYKTNSKYLINYNGKPEQGYQVIPFSRVLSKEFDTSCIEDSIVLIGFYATGNAYNKDNPDEYYTTISHNVKMFGVEIHANIINNIYNDSFVNNANVFIQYIFNIIFICAIIFVITRLKFLYSTIVAFTAILFEFILGIILYNANVFYPTTSLCLIILIGYIIVVVYNYVREKLEKGAVIKTFKQYMAPQVVEAFMKDNKQSSNLVGERRDVACLFVDIRGFTRMSETLVDPVKVVKILNDYLGMTTKKIFDNDGMLDKFIGDACMAIFNAPFDIDDYEFKAIKAGLGIVKYGEPIAKQVFEEYGITIGFGVGVNCGEAIIGNIGCDFRKDYTGIGDTINTASRLESNAKGGQVIISEETLNRVDENGNYKLKDRLIVEENGYLNLKGKAKPVLTFNVIGVKENNEVKEGENGETTNDSKD